MAWIAGKRGAYRVRWREGGRGAPVQSSARFEDRADAEAELRAVKARLREDQAMQRPASPSAPIPELLKRWGISRLTAGHARGPWVEEAKGHITRICREMGWTSLSAITAEGIDRWRSGKEGGRGTDKPLQALKGWLRWCHSTARLRVDPYALVVPPRKAQGANKGEMLTPEQVATIYHRALGCGGLSCAVLVEHLALYGCRPIDACRLLVGDWDSSRRCITYRRTKNKRDVPHPVDEAHAAKLDALAKGRPADAFLFLRPTNEPWPIDAKGRAIALVSWYRHQVAEPLEVKRAEDGTVTGWLQQSQLGMYRLKDFAITRLMQLTGGNLALVASITGHRSTSVLQRYLTHNWQEAQRIAYAIPALPLAPPAA